MEEKLKEEIKTHIDKTIYDRMSVHSAGCQLYSRRRASWLLGGQSGLKRTWDWLLKINLRRGNADSLQGVVRWYH
jgi:hypothetical protein